MMTCRDAAALASRAMDNPLPWRQRLSLRMHLAMCRYCARYQRQLVFLRLAARAVDDAEGPENALSPEAKDRIRTRLLEDQTGG